MKINVFFIYPIFLLAASCVHPDRNSKVISKATYIQTEEFSKLNLPFSQAVQYENLIYVSGQIGDLEETGELIEGGIIPESGFHALLCGIRSGNGKFLYLGERSDFWSSSKSDQGQWFYILDGKTDGKPDSFLDSKEGTAGFACMQDNATGGKSVRLFKD